MKKEVINVGIESLPWGFCSQCLDRMRAGGNAYEGYPIGDDGTQLWHAYCAHREVGASLLIRPGRPRRWRLVTPIDALEWQRYIEIQLQSHGGVLQAIKEIETEVPPGPSKH